MSYRVLVVPEDATYDQYILKPLVEALLDRAGRPANRVTILGRTGPQGFESAVDYCRHQLVDSPHSDLVLFMPDRDHMDGQEGRPDRTAQLQALETDVRRQGFPFVVCAAIEEVEVWLMAGHPEKLQELDLNFPQVRTELKPSQGSFRRFITRFGDRSPGQGRKNLAIAAARDLDRVLRSCPELQDLLTKIAGGQLKSTPVVPSRSGPP